MVVYDMIHGFMTACIWAGGEFVIALRAILSNRAYMEYKSAAIAHITDTNQTSRHQGGSSRLEKFEDHLGVERRASVNYETLRNSAVAWLLALCD